MKTELILPNNAGYLSLARNYVQELCALAGLKTEEADALVLAADEACTNTIEHAFEPGEAGAFAIMSELTPLALTVRSMTVACRSMRRWRPSIGRRKARTWKGSHARAWALSDPPGGGRSAVDQPRPGRQGATPDQASAAVECDGAPAVGRSRALSRDEPQAPPQEYPIRWLRPDETIWVSQCIYRAYGDTHPNDFLYYPERMAHMLEAGEIIVAAAVGEAGDLAGFDRQAGRRPRGRTARSSRGAFPSRPRPDEAHDGAPRREMRRVGARRVRGGGDQPPVHPAGAHQHRLSR